MSTPQAPARIGLFNQLLRFGLSGGFAAIFDFGTTLGLAALGLEENLSRILGFALGSTLAYLINRRWTFRSQRDTREVASIALIYGLTYVIIGVLNWTTLQLLPTALPKLWSVAIAWIVSQGIGSTANFVAQRTLVFRR